VVPERGGTPFRQIFLSRNGASVNIVYHSRNADSLLKRSGKSAQVTIHEIWLIGSQENH